VVWTGSTVAAENTSNKFKIMRHSRLADMVSAPTKRPPMQRTSETREIELDLNNLTAGVLAILKYPRRAANDLIRWGTTPNPVKQLRPKIVYPTIVLKATICLEFS
jgi:hypothetical protein